MLVVVAPVAASDRGFDSSRFKRGYRTVLESWAEGSDTAIAQLLELERQAIADSEQERIESLSRAKRDVLTRLVEGGRLELLVPIVLLHERSYLEYLRDSSPVLATHARTMTTDWLEYFADRAVDAQDRRLVGAMLTSLAQHLRDSSLLSAGDALYRRALEIDPANAAALLGRAAILEQGSKYEEAVALLRAMLLVAPESREGRLRLAVNLARVGLDLESQGILEEILSENAVDWVLSVAYQELARGLAGFDEIAARDLLEQAAGRIPDDAAVRIQLAFFQDRLGLPPRSDLRESLEASTSMLSDSPRRRYLRTSSAAVDEVRADLQRRSIEILPRLAAALRAGRR